MEIDVFRIKIILAEQKKTQAQLADACLVTRQDISRILKKGRCNTATAGKIASGLGVHVTEILKEDNNGFERKVD